jgi:hypothetical protein
MSWLGYTATFFSNEKSSDFNWIKYSAWEDAGGLKLPSTLTWYNHEKGKPTEPRNDVEFVNIKVSEDPLDQKLFVGP